MKKAKFIKQFTASFTTGTYDRIKTITESQGISMGEWLRTATDEKLESLDQEISSQGGTSK